MRKKHFISTLLTFLLYVFLLYYGITLINLSVFVWFFNVPTSVSLTFSHEVRLSVQNPSTLVSLAAAILTFWLKRVVVVHQVAESPKH